MSPLGPGPHQRKADSSEPQGRLPVRIHATGAKAWRALVDVEDARIRQPRLAGSLPNVVFVRSPGLRVGWRRDQLTTRQTYGKHGPGTDPARDRRLTDAVRTSMLRVPGARRPSGRARKFPRPPDLGRNAAAAERAPCGLGAVGHTGEPRAGTNPGRRQSDQCGRLACQHRILPCIPNWVHERPLAATVKPTERDSSPVQ
jgi:hypothetical protein